MDRAAGSGIEVKSPQSPELRNQPDKNKYFFRAEGPNQHQPNQPQSYPMGGRRPIFHLCLAKLSLTDL